MTKTASEILQDEFISGSRHSAVYDQAFDAAMALLVLGKGQEPSEVQFERCKRAAEEADAKATFGFDYQRDRNGEPLEQGIGVRGRETGNHFAALRANELRGQEPPGAYEAALREIWKRDPKRAEALRLPRPVQATA